MKKFPPRLHVLLARESSKAVVFRRGPNKYVATYLWDRKDDSFTLGQWLKGRIYEKRSDISPDGKYMIYFAANHQYDSETKGSWTAISKTPWLKAIELYAKGDCWEGGGLFLDNKKFWLNDRYFNENCVLQKSSLVHRDQNFKPEKIYGAESPSVYYLKLQRDGWKLLEKQGTHYNHVTIFTKPLPKNWILRKFAHEQIGSPEGKGCYWDEHELMNTNSDTHIPCEHWEWADFDGKHILYAQHGCLYRQSIKSERAFSEPKMLFDFNDTKFEERTAPY